MKRKLIIAALCLSFCAAVMSACGCDKAQSSGAQSSAAQQSATKAVSENKVDSTQAATETKGQTSTTAATSKPESKKESASSKQEREYVLTVAPKLEGRQAEQHAAI